MMLISSGQRKSGQYLFDKNDFIEQDIFKTLPNDSPICIPLVVDTEFYTPHFTDEMAQGIINSRLPITFQCNHLFSSDVGKIFVYPDFATWSHEQGLNVRHPILSNGFVLVDYLQSRSYDCEISRTPDFDELKALPICEFVIYAHFAIAELYLLTLYDTEDLESSLNVFREDINSATLKKRIQFGKRAFCKHSIQTGPSRDSIYLPWKIRIENHWYRVKLAIFDTAALHGTKSYKVLAANAGVKLTAKDLMKGRIEKMHVAYHEVPSDFDDYALGDLKTYEILECNAMNFEHAYESLGISDYYTPPKMSIGATVANIFRAKLGQLFDVSGKELRDIIDNYCRKGNAQFFLTKRSLTSALLAKVDGGRCRNNRPIDTLVKGALCDLDISGCYGEGQRSQLYPLGNPLVLEFPIESKVNQYPSLRQFLESVKYETDDCELVYGMWFARVTTKKPLQYMQDFVSSWFDYTFNGLDSEEHDNTDVNEHIADALDTKTGRNKILLNEIVHGVIQSDFLDWLFHVCGQRQRSELLDNLYIESAVIYPKSERCETIEELVSRQTLEKGQNTCILEYKSIHGITCKIMTERESYAWYGINLGELIIDDLMARRKTYPKKNPDGTVNSFNELYKLLVNTLYGIMASPYFDIANTTVGNNITARARALAYYIEKGLNAYQIITDGGTFNLNRVVYPQDSGRDKVTATDYCAMYRTNSNNRNYTLRSLGGYTKIHIIYPANLYPVLCLYTGANVKALQGKDAENWINKETFKHLQNLFPNVTVLHGESSTLKIKNNDHAQREYIPRIGLYEFEMKDFYTSGIFHSSANYWLTSPKANMLKMRSYENKRHDTVQFVDGEIVLANTYDKQTPAQFFMTQLQFPKTVERGSVFTKDTILKIGEYIQRQNSLYDKSILVPGDTYWKQGLLREFSLSQFTFRTMEQCKEWDKRITKMKEKHGQSIEMFFINQDGTLNYQSMIKWFDSIIDRNIRPTKAIRDLAKERLDHPNFQNLSSIRKELSKRARTFEYLYGDIEDD